MTQKSLPFQNPDLPLQERIEDLISRMSPAEKIGQLRYDSPAIEHLGVPPYNWWSEALHGVARNGVATIFPQAIGLAATWDPELVEQVACAISDEARAKHHAAIRRGSHQQNQGLTFWSPNINIFRDPRWGRGQETWGEDPWFTGEMASAFVRGMQGYDPKYLKTAACAKHYAVHSGPENDRHTFNAKPSLQDFRETYLPAFEKLVRDGVESVMGAYNRVYDEPCCGSNLLLREILRDEWGFEGHVVSDCWAIKDFHKHHKVTQRPEESAALALKNGCDLNCGTVYCSALEDALMTGLVSEDDLDTALRNLLHTRFRLGMFDPPEQVPFAGIGLEVVRSEKHLQLARQSAAKGMVLLKNNGILPLDNSHQNLRILGPLAANPDALLGNYYGISPRLVTLLEGVAGALEEGQRAEYRPGSLLVEKKSNPNDWAIGDALGSDVVILGLGINNMIEGEEGDSLYSAESGDRSDIALPEAQMKLFRDLMKELTDDGRKESSTRVVVVLFSGSALAVPEIQEQADAVLQVWYPGEAGGDAIADVLFGKTNPQGRLPITVPRATEDLPDYSDYSMAGRTYKFQERPSLYPFGFGLDYTTYAFKDLEVAPEIRIEQKPSDEEPEPAFTASVRVQNTGDRDGTQVVQLYATRLNPPTDDQGRAIRVPRYQLVSFARVAVPAGQSVTAELQVPLRNLRFYDNEGVAHLAPGSIRLTAAAAAPYAEALELGAPEPLTAEIKLVD